MRLTCLFIVAALLAAGSAQAASLSVTVRTAQGPVAGATVCVGTSTDRVLYGMRTTTQNGSVSFTGLPNGPLVVTANAAGRGTERALPRPLALVMLQLPAQTGGPACPTGSPTQGTGTTSQTIGIDTAGIQQRAEEVLATQPDIGGRITLQHPPEACFGAAGSQCGAQQGLAGFCVGNQCPVNGGSWEHDECCWRIWPRAGKGCVQGPIDMVTQPLDNACTDSWNKAIARTFGGWSWFRTVNTQLLNGTGTVTFAAYCATAGSVIHMGDVNYCCSRSARAVLAADVSLLGARAGLRSTARICN